MDVLRTGCCNEYGGPDFSKMDLKNLEGVCWVSHVNWCEKSFWFNVANIICLPAFISVIGSMKWSPFPQIMSPTTFLEIAAFLFNVLKYIKFQQMILLQPEWDVLQSNLSLFTGYQMMVMGLLLTATCLGGYGPWNALFCLDFRGSEFRGSEFRGSEFRESSEESSSTSHRNGRGSRKSHDVLSMIPQHYIDLNKVLKAASFFCQMGYSLIFASQAGVVVTILQALAHYCNLSSF